MTPRIKSWAVLGLAASTALCLQLANASQPTTPSKKGSTQVRPGPERPPMPPMGEPPMPLETQLHLNDDQAKLFEDLMNTAHAYHYVDPAAQKKLSTPERIAKINALQQEQAKKVEAVVKKFYSALDAEQKKTFDDISPMLLMPGPGMPPSGPRPEQAADGRGPGMGHPGKMGGPNSPQPPQDGGEAPRQPG
ncbi:Spy/CpxP family protein refolding chaperone [Curvibacter sp. CHRR-16]|uniref:Spy/CpxP family protein refolding chaperone n=1 Tax=Curvibacter sp. CHRR-16 TaxID=2835872 RepID=UPI001BDA9B7C|nr:Spy/CpxP family protein refolding chaperone [Curvibacter sp. CHRR-16]MBT0569792.1 Spy/CpxP family protein refolding chaperone [Curvibacter sp. CHRR-16]